MNMTEYEKTIAIILNPMTVFVSHGSKSVIAIPKEDKKSTDS